jgi:hypothetical protein
VKRGWAVGVGGGGDEGCICDAMRILLLVSGVPVHDAHDKMSVCLSTIAFFFFVLLCFFVSL